VTVGTLCVDDGDMWPADADALVARQEQLAALTPPTWRPSTDQVRIGACWVCFPRGSTGAGAVGEAAWSASVVVRGGALLAVQVSAGSAQAPYTAGLLALRIGPLLEQVVRGLPEVPDVLLLDGTARDHPRRAGLALHLGAELGLPTVGVTHRPLLASGEWPVDARGATSPLRIGAEVVGSWVRTRTGVRPLAVHPGWRVDLRSAIDLVLLATGTHRTPEPLRLARQAARAARSADAPGA
jgi:deoxyribonuclease V